MTAIGGKIYKNKVILIFFVDFLQFATHSEVNPTNASCHLQWQKEKPKGKQDFAGHSRLCIKAVPPG